MWDWIRAYGVPLYDTFWDLLGMREYKFIYKKDFFEEFIDIGITDTEEVRKKASESRKRYYEERGMSATEMTHSPEAKAKRSETRAIKAKIRDSKEYSEWYEKQSKKYYHKGDGVKDFLKEKGLTYYREYGTGKSN